MNNERVVKDAIDFLNNIPVLALKKIQVTSKDWPEINEESIIHYIFDISIFYNDMKRIRAKIITSGLSDEEKKEQAKKYKKSWIFLKYLLSNGGVKTLVEEVMSKFDENDNEDITRNMPKF